MEKRACQICIDEEKVKCCGFWLFAYHFARLVKTKEKKKRKVYV